MSAEAFPSRKQKQVESPPVPASAAFIERLDELKTRLEAAGENSTVLRHLQEVRDKFIDLTLDHEPNAQEIEDFGAKMAKIEKVAGILKPEHAVAAAETPPDSQEAPEAASQPEEVPIGVARIPVNTPARATEIPANESATEPADASQELPAVSSEDLETLNRKGSEGPPHEKHYIDDPHDGWDPAAFLKAGMDVPRIPVLEQRAHLRSLIQTIDRSIPIATKSEKTAPPPVPPAIKEQANVHVEPGAGAAPEARPAEQKPPKNDLEERLPLIRARALRKHMLTQGISVYPDAPRAAAEEPKVDVKTVETPVVEAAPAASAPKTETAPVSVPPVALEKAPQAPAPVIVHEVLGETPAALPRKRLPKVEQVPIQSTLAPVPAPEAAEGMYEKTKSEIDALALKTRGSQGMMDRYSPVDANSRGTIEKYKKAKQEWKASHAEDKKPFPSRKAWHAEQMAAERKELAGKSLKETTEAEYLRVAPQLRDMYLAEKTYFDAYKKHLAERGHARSLSERLKGSLFGLWEKKGELPDDLEMLRSRWMGKRNAYSNAVGDRVSKEAMDARALEVNEDLFAKFKSKSIGREEYERRRNKREGRMAAVPQEGKENLSDRYRRRMAQRDAQFGAKEAEIRLRQEALTDRHEWINVLDQKWSELSVSVRASLTAAAFASGLGAMMALSGKEHPHAEKPVVPAQTQAFQPPARHADAPKVAHPHLSPHANFKIAPHETKKKSPETYKSGLEDMPAQPFSIQAGRNTRYEDMLKEMHDRLQLQYSTPEAIASAPRDIRELLSGDFTAVAHQMAIWHKFYDPKHGTTVMVPEGATLSIDAFGHIKYDDRQGTLAYHEVSKDVDAYEKAKADWDRKAPEYNRFQAEQSSGPMRSAPKPQGIQESFTNRLGVQIDPSAPHIYHRADGSLVAYGGQDQRKLIEFARAQADKLNQPIIADTTQTLSFGPSYEATKFIPSNSGGSKGVLAVKDMRRVAIPAPDQFDSRLP